MCVWPVYTMCVWCGVCDLWCVMSVGIRGGCVVCVRYLWLYVGCVCVWCAWCVCV